MRNATLSLLVAVFLLVAPVNLKYASAAQQEVASVSVEGFVPDITEAEWEAALPAKGSGVELKQISGPKKSGPPRGLPHGQAVFAKVAVVVRSDGTQGVYKVIATNHPAFALELINTVRKQQFKPPMRQGTPVTLRGEISEQVTVTK